MIFKEDYIFAGKILKTYGYQGELSVKLEDFAKGILNEEEPIFLEIEGICVPFFIDTYLEVNDVKSIISLYDINSDTEAEEYSGYNIYIQNCKADLNTNHSEVNNTIEGCFFHDIASDKKGIVNNIIDIPGNTLLNVIIDKEEFLIPFNEDLIEDFNQNKSLLIMKLPEGLLDQE